MSYQDPWDVFQKEDNKKSNDKVKKDTFQKQQTVNKNYPFQNFDFDNILQKKFIPVAILVLLLIWLSTGIYIIKQEERGVIVRFGKYVRDANPGLNYKFPYPVEALIKESTARIRVIRIGENSNSTSTWNKNNTQYQSENLMLTGDENIVNIAFEIHWKIDNLEKFAFNVKDQNSTIYDAAQSAIREIISQQKLAAILTNNRAKIEEEVKQLLQEIVNSYNSGIDIVSVQMLKSDPPTQVIDAFKDVQTARVDKESEMNKALAYENEITYNAKGEAKKILEEAKSYAIKTVNDAKGNASRFDQIYTHYRNAGYATRQRLYIETMEDVFNNGNITIVDANIKNIILNNNNVNTVQNKETAKVSNPASAIITSDKANNFANSIEQNE